MPNPVFRVPCKIDGEDHTIDVQTHGNRSVHPDQPIIRTVEQAKAHVQKMAEVHKIDNGDGTFHYAAHIDAAGDEHTITDIGTPTVVGDGQQSRLKAAGSPAQIAAIAGAPDAPATRSRKRE